MTNPVDPSSTQGVDVSVVIPVLNAVSDLPLQLRALTAQDYSGGWEVVVADNGSTDGTPGVVESFAERLTVRTVVAAGRRGRAAACNGGAAAATGRYLVFLDADDVVDHSYLSAMVAALDQSDFVASRLDCESLNPGWIAESRSPAQRTGLGAGHFPYAYGASIGIWHTSFDRIGGFDESYNTAEDIDLCYRMALAGSALQFVPDAVLRYRFRHTIPGMCRQAYAYGLGGARVRHRFAYLGADKSPGRARARATLGAARLAVNPRSKGARARGLYLLANQLGGFIGDWRERTSRDA